MFVLFFVCFHCLVVKHLKTKVVDEPGLYCNSKSFILASSTYLKAFSRAPSSAAWASYHTKDLIFLL